MSYVLFDRRDDEFHDWAGSRSGHQYYAELSAEFESDEDWADICSFAVSLDEKFGLSDDFGNRYAEIAESRPPQNLLFAMMTDTECSAAAQHGAA